MTKRQLSFATALLVSASPAFAQEPTSSNQASETGVVEDSTGLADIVVTATRRSENLQDVPVAISAVTGDDLQNRGVFQTNDLSGAVPNLQVSSAYGTSQPNFSLRGVGVANEYNANAASPVGVYVDEVYQTFRASHGQQLYDLDRIEVVRGPQGTLYGRNTTGGAINFITRQPSLSGSNGYVTVGYGNYDRRNAEGALEGTLVDGTLGIRVAGTFVNSDPYLVSINGSGSSGGDRVYAVRGILRWKLAPTVDISLKGYIGRSKGGYQAPIAVGVTADPDAPITFGGLGAAFGLNYSRAGLPKTQFEGNTTGIARNEASGAVLTAKIELADHFNFMTISGYDDGRYFQGPVTECDGTPIDVCAIGYDSKFKAFNQDFRLSYDGERLKVIGGIYYGWDRINNNNHINFFGVLSGIRASLGLPATAFNPGGLFGALFPNDTFPTPLKGEQYYDQTRRSRAIYAEATYDLTQQLSLTGGLRYTKDRSRYFNGRSIFFDDTGDPRLVLVSGNPGGAPVVLTPGCALPPTLSQDGGANALTGRAIINYKPVEKVMLYASYSRGYRAGTFNGLAYASPAQVYFVKPEKVNAYELGFKSRFLDNRAQLNGAVFLYDYRGQQVQEVVGATGFLRSLDGTMKGFELEAEFRATPSLMLSAALGILDSKYKKGQFLAPGDARASDPRGIAIGGNEFPFAPRQSFNAGFDWDAVDDGQNKLSLHGDAQFTGKFYYDSFNDRQATGVLSQGSHSFWLFNSRLTYSRDNYSISAWVKNIGDKLYYPFGLNLEGAFGVSQLIRGQPRTYGIEATAKF